MIRTIAFIFTILFSNVCFSANKYVDCSNGSDSNSGEVTSQWKTITYAQTHVSPGDVVHIASGTCGSVIFDSTGVSGTSEYKVTFKGSGDTIFTSLAFSPSSGKAFHYIIEDIHVLKSYSSGYTPWADSPRTSLGGMCSFSGGATDITIRNVEIAGYTADDNLPAPYTGVQFNDGGISRVVLDKIDLHTVTTGILQYGVPAGGETGNVIKNSKIHDLMGSAIGSFAGLTSITNTIISDEIPEAYYTSHTGGSGLAMRGGNITINNVIIKNYGFTRPIRWYQGVAGDNGYQNVDVSNLLVYYTTNGTTITNPATLLQKVYTYNKYAEIIDAGNNFNIKNSTFTGGVTIFLATNNDGSGLSLYNNLISSLTLNNHYATSSVLAAQTCDQAFVKWDKVVENKNIYGNLQASGGGYLCSYSYFTPTSESIKTSSFASLFVNTTQPNNDYHLAANSQAINFGEVAHQAPGSLGPVVLGFVTEGVGRDSSSHSAGAYEISSTVNSGLRTLSGQLRSVGGHLLRLPN